MGEIQKEEKWVPHEFTETNKNLRVEAYFSFLNKQGQKAFLWKIVMGSDDNKWILYDNPKRRKSWVNPGESSRSISLLHRETLRFQATRMKPELLVYYNAYMLHQKNNFLRRYY